MKEAQLHRGGTDLMMKHFTKFAAVLALFAGLTAVPVDDAEARRGRAGAWIAGAIIGSAALGILAHQNRYYHDRHYYRARCYRGRKRCRWKRDCYYDRYGYRHCEKYRSCYRPRYCD